MNNTLKILYFFSATQIISTPCACAIKIPIATGRVNIRIHRDITGEMWFGVRREAHKIM